MGVGRVVHLGVWGGVMGPTTGRRLHCNSMPKVRPPKTVCSTVMVGSMRAQKNKKKLGKALLNTEGNNNSRIFP